jgi:phosphinothricin acetyltransferase
MPFRARLGNFATPRPADRPAMRRRAGPGIGDQGMQIIDTTLPHLPEVQAIYAHHVLHGTGTFENVPPSVEEMQVRYQACLADGFDWLSACDATGVLGFGYYGRFRARHAYDWTVEDSVYVRDDVRGQGVGKALVAALLQRAEARGFRQMLALIGDSDNIGSIGMHSSLGFSRTGILRAAGVKFGRWLDVVIMQRPLGEADGSLPALAPNAERRQTGTAH